MCFFETVIRHLPSPQYDHMKPCHRHRLPEIDAQFEALFPSGRPPPPRQYAYANNPRYAYGRLLWEHIPDDRRNNLIEKFGGNEDVARQTYVRWTRSNPVYAD